MDDTEVTLEQEIERCRPWLQDALDAGGNTHTIEDVVDAVRKRIMQFWPAEDACAVTEILHFPRKKSLHIFLAGGNLDTIVDMRESAEHFAKINGCAMMSVSGRKGWQRVLGKHGYGNTLTVLEKRIS
tara:strand:- start:272 stop:655 length:384 start_codon:yes stop_codon:yes gene_type:complete